MKLWRYTNVQIYFVCVFYGESILWSMIIYWGVLDISRKRTCCHFWGTMMIQKTKWYKRISVTKILRGCWIEVIWLLLDLQRQMGSQTSWLVHFHLKALVGRWSYPRLLEGCCQLSTPKIVISCFALFVSLYLPYMGRNPFFWKFLAVVGMLCLLVRNANFRSRIRIL